MPTTPDTRSSQDTLPTAPNQTASRRVALGGLLGGALAAVNALTATAGRDRKDRRKARKRRQKRRAPQPPTALPCDVCDDGCAYTSIQQAIDSTAAGGTVRICDGSYRNGPTIQVNKALTLVGAGAEETTLRGSGQVRVFDVGPQGNVTLRDLEITGGVEKQQARKGGAGIMVWDGGKLTVERCLITDNYAAEGAGIVVSRGATLTLLDTDVEHNTAFGVGGGLIARAESTVTIKAGTRIAGNYARIWAGGILAEEGSVVTLEAGSQVTRNTSDNPGGGILSRRATVNLAGPSIVTGNVPDNCGGAEASPIESCIG